MNLTPVIAKVTQLIDAIPDSRVMSSADASSAMRILADSMTVSLAIIDEAEKPFKSILLDLTGVTNPEAVVFNDMRAKIISSRDDLLAVADSTAALVAPVTGKSIPVNGSMLKKALRPHAATELTTLKALDAMSKSWAYETLQSVESLADKVGNLLKGLIDVLTALAGAAATLLALGSNKWVWIAAGVGAVALLMYMRKK